MQELIQQAFSGERPLDHSVEQAVDKTIEQLEQGQLRVCEKVGEQWQTHPWIKAAILLYFRLRKMHIIRAGDLQFYDKIPLRQWDEQTGGEGGASRLGAQGGSCGKGGRHHA